MDTLGGEDYSKSKTIMDYMGGNGNTLSHFRPFSATLEFEEAEEKLDELDPMKCVGITITFMPCLLDRWHPITLREMVEKQIRKTLKKASEDTGVILIGEFSPVGRWHYHGILYSMSGDIIARLHRACRTHFGRTEVKMIRYHESYIKYLLDSYRLPSTKVIEPQLWNSNSHVVVNI